MNSIKIRCLCGHASELHRPLVPNGNGITCDFFLGFTENYLYKTVHCNCDKYRQDNLKYLEELSGKD